MHTSLKLKAGNVAGYSGKLAAATAAWNGDKKLFLSVWKSRSTL